MIPLTCPAITLAMTPAAGVAVGMRSGPNSWYFGARHLLARRQVQPQLEAAHAALLLLGHLRVHEAASRGHPLHAAGHEHALVAVVVAVTHATIEHVGDGLEAAVRVIGKAGDVVLGPVGAELIEHEERIKVRQLRLADDAAQLDAGAIRGRHASHDTLHRAGGELG